MLPLHVHHSKCEDIVKKTKNKILFLNVNLSFEHTHTHTKMENHTAARWK